MRRMPLLLLVIALVLSLGGCGAEEKKVAPLELGDSTDQPSQSATPSPSEEQQPFDDKGSEVLRGKIEATTPEQQAVVDAWFAYWDVRARSYGRAEVDPALGRFAAATAVSDVVGYVRHLQHDKLHTVGDAKFDVSKVQVDGSSALLSSCAVNKSLDVTADGTPAEQPVPFFTADGALVQRAGHWRVVYGQGRGDPAGLPLATGVTAGLPARCTG